MFQPSLIKLFERSEDGNVLQVNNVGHHKFSVFSERNRKKAFKYFFFVHHHRYVTKIKKAIQEEKSKKNGQKEIKKTPKEEVYKLEEEITCKYLKCLEMELKRVELVVSR